jgi:HJR/Mrr/RecB family endonuclease
VETADQTFRTAAVAQQSGRADDAIAGYRRVLAIQPDHVRALVLLATLLHQRGQINDAVELLSRAVALEPQSPQWRVNLGFALKAAGKTGDQGVDLIAERGGLCLAIQAKCYTNYVGNGTVQEVFAGMHHYRCHRCVVITNSVFSQSARSSAMSTGCRLVEGRVVSSSSARCRPR